MCALVEFDTDAQLDWIAENIVPDDDASKDTFGVRVWDDKSPWRF